MRPALGSLVGAIGGLVFVLVNASGTGAGLDWPLRALALGAFGAVLWFAVLRPWAGQPGGRPAPDALRRYLLSVAAMVLAIPLGAWLLRRLLERPELTLPWVVVVVGAHFLPMSRAFGAPVLLVLGWCLVGVGLLGGVLTLLGGATWPSWTGVVAGFALLAAAATGAVRSSPPTR